MKKAFLLFSMLLCSLFYNMTIRAQIGSPAFDNCPDSLASAGTLNFPASLQICTDGEGFQLVRPTDDTYDTYEFIFENPNQIIPPGLLPGTPGGSRIVTINSTGIFNPADYGMVEGEVICGIGFNYNLANLQSFIDGFTPGTLCCNLLGGFGIDCAAFPEGNSVTSLGDLLLAFNLDTIDLPDIHAALQLLGSLGCPTAPCYVSTESVCMTIVACEPPCEASYGSVLFEGATTLCPTESISPMCLSGDNMSEGYSSYIVLTAGAELAIITLNEVCNNINISELPAGNYTLHALNILTDDLGALSGVTTGGEVAALINAGIICAALDVTGTPITILAADDPICVGPQPPQTTIAVLSPPPFATSVSFILTDYASDPNGDPLTFDVLQPTEGGTLTFDPISGFVEVIFAPGFTGTITINYTVSDGTFDIPGSVSINVEGSLDVALLQLKAKVVEDGNLIEWTTASETNNHHFDLYRTQNAQQGYQHITTISGAGNSSSLKNYAYMDKNAPTGITYYRLTQTDYDGTVTELGTAVVQRSNNTPMVSVVPNPVNATAHIEFVLAQGGKASIALHDISGKLVTTQDVVLQNGFNSIPLETALYPAGVYFVTITHQDCVLMTKLLKQ